MNPHASTCQRAASLRSDRSSSRRRRIGVAVSIPIGLWAAVGALALPAWADDAPPAVPAGAATAAADTTVHLHRVLAYYFHTSQRCATCRRIEAFTAEAIQSGFPEELKAGRLVFQALNVDEPENKHFLTDFKLFTKSVVLVDEQAGERVAWKSLPKIWELNGDKTKFILYIQGEVRAYLAGKQP